MNGPSFRAGRSVRGLSALLAAALLVLTLPIGAAQARRRIVVPAPLASGAPVLALGKAVDGAPDPLLPGSAFSYRLTLACSSLKLSCVNAVIEDTLPAEFDVTTLPVSTPTRTVSYDPGTRKLTIRFVSLLPAPPNPAGSVGLEAGTSSDVEIAMRVPADGPLKNGETVTNTATAVADNASQVIDSAALTVTVPKNLDARATKSWEPGSDVAMNDGESTITLGTANTSSNSSEIDRLSVDESTPDLFDNFDLVSLGPVTTMPDGADRVTVLVCTKPVGSPCSDAELIRGQAVPGPGLTLPSGVDADKVTGVRFEFTSSTGAFLDYDPNGASVPMKVRLRRTVRRTGAALDPAVRKTVRNCATPGVHSSSKKFNGRGSVVGAPACANHDILPNIATVDLGKKFYPDDRGDFTQSGTAVLGERSGVTAVVTARNTSPFAVATMTITEPSASAVSEFDKVDLSTVKVDFPTGATSAALKVVCRNGTVLPPVTLTGSRTLPTGCPAGSPAKEVSITFTGEDADGAGTIVPGATAKLSVHGKLNGKENEQDVKDGITDCADGSATNPLNGAGSTAATGCATLPLEQPREDGRGVKTSSQQEIPAGQPVTYTLGLVNDGNVFLPDVVVTDPPDPAAAGNPFDSLRITGVSFGASPSTLPFTVQLYDPSTSTWVDYLPADTALLTRAKGVRLLAPDGLPVKASIRADVTVVLRDGVTSGTLRNCFTTSIGGRTPNPPTCSTDLVVGPARAGASLQKTLSPSNVVRPTTGLTPLDVTVRLTAVNSGNLGLRRLVLSDTDPRFFDAVTVTRLAGVTFPLGANRVKVDVCTTGCAAVPPVFVAGTVSGSTNPGFPAGVAAADVQGIRVTFSSSTGGYDLLPATSAPSGGNCSGSSVCLVVQPRITLRSAPTTPIPAIVPDTASGQGESRLQPDGGSFDIPPSSADLTVKEGTTRLRVEKAPADTVLSPGTPAPFTLTTRNTGTAPMQDLVVIDEVAAGLRFDDGFNGGGGLPYSISYVLPPGSPKPTTVQFDPVRDANGQITKLVWRFPGFLLPPGGQVALGYQVRLAGGVAAGTRIPNVYGAGSATQPGVTCDPASPRLGTVVDDPRYGPGTFCTSSAQITTRAGVSFDTAKWVSGDPTLGFQDSNSGLHIPIGDPRCPSLTLSGTVYTRYPCIALTYPGQRFSYLLRVENTGTEPARSLRLLDVFPAPGDTGVLLGGDQRGTEWDSVPALTGPVQYTGPGDASIAYTSTANPCGQKVPTPRRACNAAVWAPGSTTDATGMEVSVDFPTGMAPGSTALFRMEFDAPADLSDPEYPATAWNSFAHSETVNSGGNTVVLPVTEPPKAGIGLVFGNLRVLKALVDPPTGITPGPFTVEYSCLLHTASGDDIEVRAGSDTFGPTRPLDLPGLPAGAVCRIWETDPAGGRTGNLGKDHAIVMTVRPAASLGEVQQDTISNEFPRRDLVISKRVTGAAATEVGSGPFTVTVDCTFNSQRLPDFPQNLVFTGNGTQTITALPIGSVCDVEETDDGGATRVDIQAVSSARVSVETSPAPGRPPLPAPVGDGSAATVVITNVFAHGSLVVEKQLTGPGAEHADRSFRFDVSCDFNGRTAVVSRGLTLRPPNLRGEITDLPVGAVCSVTETDGGGADQPAEPVRFVTIKEGSTDLASATLSNTFSVGHLTLSKQITGTAADAPYLKDARYALHVICVRTGENDQGDPHMVTVLDRSFLVTAGTPLAVPTPLPIGSRCWAAEPGNAGAHDTVIDHPDAGNPALVTITAPEITITAANEYRPARLRLAKRTTGPGRDQVAGTVFVLELSCVLPGDFGTPAITVLDRRPYRLRPGQTVEVDDLGFPLTSGARCFVTEPDRQGATSVHIDHGTSADAVVLDADRASLITVTNDYSPPVPPVPPRPPVPPLPNTGSAPVPWALGSLGLLLVGAAAKAAAGGRIGAGFRFGFGFGFGFGRRVRRG